jgi:hypothetical protein
MLGGPIQAFFRLPWRAVALEWGPAHSMCHFMLQRPPREWFASGFSRRLCYLVTSVLSGDSHAFEELAQPLGSVRGKTHFEAPRGFLGRRLTAGKHGRLVLRQCGLDVIAVLGDRQRQFSRVDHGRFAPSPAYGDITCAASPSNVTPGERAQQCPIGKA